MPPSEGLGVLLAEGACAEVYAWGDGSRIVKVAKPNTNLFALQRELRLCRIAAALGLPVPQPHDLIEIEGRYGIVLERVAGETMLQRFASAAAAVDPSQAADNVDYLSAALTARMLHRVHKETAEDVPPQRASLERDIRRSPHLSDTEKDAVMAQLDRLPERRQLCHGDPNPGNFIIRDGVVVILDWNNATLGNPEADLAEYVLMLRYATLPSNTPLPVAQLFDAIRERSIDLFVAQYEQLSGIGAAHIEPWIAPIAARKLAVDGIGDAERDHLVIEVRRRL
jgi:uncharacterized protein (TIGR02172 family)